jgi:hypothetical protein
MHANRHEEIEEADAGAIVAAMGLKDTFTGDTLCPIEEPVLLESIRFPEPVLSVAIEPKTRADRDKMIDGLTKLSEEDPTFKVTFNEETGQTVISGMGELHVEVLVSRLLSEYRVAANVGRPRVAYKETLAASAKVEGRFVRQSGGRGQYGHVLVEFSPNEAGKGIELADNVRGGAIPRSTSGACRASARPPRRRRGWLSIVDIKPASMTAPSRGGLVSHGLHDAGRGLKEAFAAKIVIRSGDEMESSPRKSSWATSRRPQRAGAAGGSIENTRRHGHHSRHSAMYSTSLRRDLAPTQGGHYSLEFHHSSMPAELGGGTQSGASGSK